MLIPRFSLRWLLGLTTLCAAVSFVLASAVRGNDWAIGMTVGIVSGLCLALLHVLIFWAACLTSFFQRGLLQTARPADGCPFATEPPGVSPFAPSSQAAATESPPPLMG